MQPFFINSRSGPLFAVYWPPVGLNVSRSVLHVPAFAEEMNKSRRMVALQANALAEQGIAVLVLDLFGTGESNGDFGESTWSIWLQNLEDAVGWLKLQGAQSVSLWGLRLGALLAMDFVNQHAGLIDRLILWQPVLNGDAFVTQFLRLRVAAAMMNSANPQEKTSDLKKQLQNGQSLEVAGYMLHPDFVRPLSTLKADCLDLQAIKEIVIYELAVVGNEGEPSLVNQQFLNKLHSFEINASLTVFEGDNFWGSQEIVTTPNLIELTIDKARQWL
ncbi:MAG: hydrolase 2, exosortase A system-associated [Methylomonas sp.]|nr:hydrolase 2, exosortase A system-associated [Methylomonas sp.]